MFADPIGAQSTPGTLPRGFQGSSWGGFQRLLASAYLLFRFSKRFFLNVVEGSEKGLNENQAFSFFSCGLEVSIGFHVQRLPGTSDLEGSKPPLCSSEDSMGPWNPLIFALDRA